MKPIFNVLMVSFFLLVAENSGAQEKDSWAIHTSGEIIDPAQNRLFMMSTGRTMPAQRFSAGDFEIFLLQLGYAPFDIVHFNFSYIFPLGSRSPYWSLGTKVQVLKPSGNFKGLAVGADVGFFDELFGLSSSYESRIVSLNAAVSAGGDDANVHFNIAQLLPTINRSSVAIEFPSYIQVGFDIALRKYGNGGGLKFMGEMLSTLSKINFVGNLVFIGFRTSGKNTVADFGWPFGFGRGGAGASPVPYFSITFFF